MPCAPYGIISKHLEALHAAGKLLLIFDGFDEMTLVSSVEERLKHFQRLWDANHTRAKIIFTGRPYLFQNEDELKAAFGMRKSSSGIPSCVALDLEKFNIDEISVALRNNPVSVRSEILESVSKNPRLYEIASRASMLHAISVLWETEKGFSEKASEMNSAEIMGTFIETSLRRQTEKAISLFKSRASSKGEESYAIKEIKIDPTSPQNYMVINQAERYYFMLGISVYMLKNKGETNQISVTELSEITEKLARACPSSLCFSSDSQVRDYNLSMQERLQQSDKFLGRLQSDVRTCGLLVKDATDGFLRFSHKSFLEYLGADYAARLHAKTQDEDITSILGVLDVSFNEVLVNGVTRGYFGEIFLSKIDSNSDNLASQFSFSSEREKIYIASFLLDKIVAPSAFNKFLWKVAGRVFKRVQSESIYSRLIRMCQMPFFINFMVSKHDRSYFSTVSKSVSLFFFTVTFISVYLYLGYFNVLQTNEFIGEPVIPAIAFGTWGYSNLFVRLLWRSILGVDSSLCRIWVDVCTEQKCDIEHLHAAILSNPDVLDSYLTDPIGILKPQRAELSDFQKETNEALRNLIGVSSSSWNQNIAAFALASRHSKFGEILFSKDLDGKVPGRNIRKSIDRKTLEKAGKKLSLSQEELVREFKSLNDFLSWDIKNGFNN